MGFNRMVLLLLNLIYISVDGPFECICSGPDCTETSLVRLNLHFWNIYIIEVCQFGALAVKYSI